MFRDKYDMSGSSYVQELDTLVDQYNNLILKAERINRRNQGEPTREEAVCYYQASKICDQIMSKHLSNRAFHNKWKIQKEMCEERVTEIGDILAPQPVAPKWQAPYDYSLDERYQPVQPVQPVAPVKPVAPVASAAPAAAAANTQSGPQAPGKTASGFETRHACKDVPATTIESWFKDPPDHDFSGVIGMEDLKERLTMEAGSFGWDRLDKVLKISPVQCYFFYGPPGSGKSHLIGAFANEMGKKGFRFMQLMGGDIHASLVGVAEKTIQIAFKEAVDKEPCLIFIDEIENVCVNRDTHADGHEKRLTVAFLEAYNILRQSGKRVIFMGATNHPEKVDEAMLNRVKLIKIPLPDEKNRERYFKKAFDSVVLEEGFDAAAMAATTESHSFRDLDNLRDTIAGKMKSEAIKKSMDAIYADGVDQETRDIQATEAVTAGDILLTRELFAETQRENPPSEDSKTAESLKAFEDRLKGINL